VKINEDKIRELIAEGHSFTIVTDSGERTKVRGKDWIFLPPLDDLADDERSDFFQVWGNGKAFRWVAFKSVSLIETKAPEETGG
jgi:hypothetical protein